MTTPPPTSPEQSLRAENAELRMRLEKSEEMLRAIRGGEVAELSAEGDAEPRFPTPQEGLDAEQSDNSERRQPSGLNVDVTERKRAEEALCASEARFRAAVGAVSSLIWTNNAGGEMEGEQPGWARFTGQLREDYQGYGWAKAVHAEDAQPTIDAWDRAVAEKRMFEFEHRVRRHDGEWRVCEVRAVPVLGEAGEICEWVGIHTDITERQQTEEALRRSEARFRRVLRQSPAGIVQTDATGLHDAGQRALVRDARLLRGGAAGPVRRGCDAPFQRGADEAKLRPIGGGWAGFPGRKELLPQGWIVFPRAEQCERRPIAHWRIPRPHRGGGGHDGAAASR